ncbi:SH3 domain-containing protein [Calderihabitans maritimus]|uniref:N-acetylmuramoyl-L-alanine amidase n=1 Tax=Calderihabitans maritimus TaxID=1246530 RepID=A0A1Z5HPQ7_9FIRM|nr:SH3 domain-containing protein [Calderihabitans maritimus]GAW91270.1 N-acetylmuramoyl-L-alanine amidase [Calderihabitans maritimus]
MFKKVCGKKSVIVFTILFLLTIAGQASVALAGKQVVVRGKYVNIRSGPGTNHTKLGRSYRGDKYPLLQKKGDWYQVQLPDGREGWLAGWLTRLEEVPEEEVEKRSARVAGSYVNVRSGPGTQYVRVGVLTRGTAVTILERQGEWYKVRYMGKRVGWIAGWLLELDEGAESSAPAEAGGEKETKVALVTGKVVNVRQGPGLNFARIDKVTEGERLPVVGEDNGWYQVVLDGGRKGWIAGWLAKVDTQSLPSGSTMVQVTGSVVNIRQGPGTDFPVITKVKRGEHLGVLAEENRWYQVSLEEGLKGWIAGWLVEARDGVSLEETQATSRGSTENNVDSGQTPSTVVDDTYNSQTDPINLDSGAQEKTGDNPSLEDDDSEAFNLISGLDEEVKEDRLLISIRGNEPPVYNTFELEDPRRLVVDITRSRLEIAPEDRIRKINHPAVSQVRLGQFTPDTVRVVFDLPESSNYTFSSQRQGTTVLFEFLPFSLAGKTVVLDPGHGSIQAEGLFDPGAIGPSGVHERDVVMAIAEETGRILSRKGATVIFTRNGDTALDLPERAAIANDVEADVFVSIHANSSFSPIPNGTATYFYAPQGTELASQRDERQFLAQMVQRELVKEINRADLGIREANFSVLRNTLVPSILVEVAFISNPEEERLLTDPEFRSRAARGIAKGIELYLLEFTR